MNTQDLPPTQGRTRIPIVVVALVLAAFCVALAVKYFRPRPESGSGKTEIVVVLPFSGKGASHGEYVKQGLQMFAKDHPNSRLHVTLVDSESDPKKAISGFQQRLLLKTPSAAISVLSGVSDALAPVAEEKQILLIGVNTATDTFVNNYSRTQRINDRPANHTAPIAQLVAKTFHRVGVIYSDDAFGQFCKTTFEATFHKVNSDELLFESFKPGERDQNVIVQRLLSKQPDTIFVAGYGQGYISLFQAFRTFKYGGPIFADINFSNPEVLAALGDAADGVVFTAMGFNVVPPSTDRAAAFLESYQREFKREPWLGSAFAYDALAILDHLDQAKQPFERKSIFSLKNWQGIAAPLSFPSPGECQYVFQFVRREAGKNVPIDLEKLVLP